MQRCIVASWAERAWFRHGVPPFSARWPHPVRHPTSLHASFHVWTKITFRLVSRAEFSFAHFPERGFSSIMSKSAGGQTTRGGGFLCIANYIMYFKQRRACLIRNCCRMRMLLQWNRMQSKKDDLTLLDGPYFIRVNIKNENLMKLNQNRFIFFFILITSVRFLLDAATGIEPNSWIWFKF